jgi:hypothetical protein
MPPITKHADPTPENVRLLDEWLTSITAYHPLTAKRPWTFYEKLDAFLGPWGAHGYPIGYGKKYCKLFYENRTLNESVAGALWVRRTLLLLQGALKSFVMERFRAGSLGSVTEAELRQVAFDSHPKAYTQGGLTMVVLLAPELVPAVAAIPRAEFQPTSPNFGSSVKQVLDTSGIVLPQMIATLLAAAAGPAHNGSLSNGYQHDLASFQAGLTMNRRLSFLRKAVLAGRCDNLDLLSRLERAVELTLFEDTSANQTAAIILDEIDARKNLVEQRYLREMAADPALRSVYDEFDEELCTWRP